MYSAALIADLIHQLGKHLYVYPGGTIAPIFHECERLGVPIVCAKTEQGAGFMAIADALVSVTPSFVAVTSGPGATNLITCIADAFYDSIPLVIFTGQVGTKDLNRTRAIRQLGFQETPVVEMVQHISKAIFQPRSPQELCTVLIQAIVIAQEGRSGPVLIDLPMDVQLAPLPDGLIDAMRLQIAEASHVNNSSPVDSEVISKIRTTLLAAARPLILAGGGALSSHASLQAFARRFGLPMVSSMRGLGVFPTQDQLCVGWIGHTGLPWANWALSQADWLLVLGSRLDVRQTGTLPEILADKVIFHVDIDQNELSHGRVPDVQPIHCSVTKLLEAFDKDQTFEVQDLSGWHKSILEQKKLLPLNDRGTDSGISPTEVLTYIDQLTQGVKTAIVTGVGSHQQWACRYFSFDAPNKQLFTSAGHGTMGYSLPVALGVKRLQPDRLVISVDGDGSFQMNIQELALIAELNLPIKILIVDNSRLGIVSQFQKITFNDDPVTGDFRNPDFIRIAEAYGLKAWDLTSMDEEIIKKWLNESGPALLRVHIQHDAYVSPMLLGGQALEAMWYAEEEA